MRVDRGGGHFPRQAMRISTLLEDREWGKDCVCFSCFIFYYLCFVVVHWKFVKLFAIAEDFATINS